jgi:hypothetical protein
LSNAEKVDAKQPISDALKSCQNRQKSASPNGGNTNAGHLCKRRLKSAAGGARKVLHLPGKEDCFFRVSSRC